MEPYRPECNIEECNRGAEPFVLTDSTCAHVSFNYNYGMWKHTIISTGGIITNYSLATLQTYMFTKPYWIWINRLCAIVMTLLMAATDTNSDVLSGSLQKKQLDNNY